MQNDKPLIDNDILEQILMLDEDDSHEFSRDILTEYFEQVETNVTKLEQLVQSKNFVEAGKVAHFLKGSSANVGAAYVRDICEELQHYQNSDELPENLFPKRIEEIKQVWPQTKKQLSSRVGL